MPPDATAVLYGAVIAGTFTLVGVLLTRAFDSAENDKQRKHDADTRDASFQRDEAQALSTSRQAAFSELLAAADLYEKQCIDLRLAIARARKDANQADPNSTKAVTDLVRESSETYARLQVARGRAELLGPHKTHVAAVALARAAISIRSNAGDDEQEWLHCMEDFAEQRALFLSRAKQACGISDGN